jgi:methylaspartate ammonia-lyase
VQIENVLFAPGNGAFFYDDQAAIRAGAEHDGFSYAGSTMTAGFTSIRMPATSLGIGLVLSDGTVVWGDSMSVQYSGAAGRDPLFQIDQISQLVRDVVVPRLIGRDPTHFLSTCDAIFEPAQGRRLPLAVEYGVSQGLLAAAAHIARQTMAEIVCTEFELPVPDKRVPIFSQSGDARQVNVDKMILKAVDVLPHGLTNSHDKFGYNGEAFREFVRWVAKRVRTLGAEGYQPTLHFDLYGWIGLGIGLQPDVVAEFIARVADDVPDFALNIECPADYGSVTAQIDGYAAIVEAMAKRGTRARIVADEHCNTLDDIRGFAEAKAAHLVQIKMPDVGSIADTAKAVLICKAHGVGAYVGGSCAETDLSARTSVHVSVATQADMMLAKPGMGVDEGLCIVGNEQSRLLATLANRNSY